MGVTFVATLGAASGDEGVVSQPPSAGQDTSLESMDASAIQEGQNAQGQEQVQPRKRRFQFRDTLKGSFRRSVRFSGSVLEFLASGRPLFPDQERFFARVLKSVGPMRAGRDMRISFHESYDKKGHLKSQHCRIQVGNQRFEKMWSQSKTQTKRGCSSCSSSSFEEKTSSLETLTPQEKDEALDKGLNESINAEV
jgi:hypothetical protein